MSLSLHLKEQLDKRNFARDEGHERPNKFTRFKRKNKGQRKGYFTPCTGLTKKNFPKSNKQLNNKGN